jgi:ribosomal protein L32
MTIKATCPFCGKFVVKHKVTLHGGVALFEKAICRKCGHKWP